MTQFDQKSSLIGRVRIKGSLFRPSLGLAQGDKSVCEMFYDELYSYISSVDVLKQMIMSRFGIKMGSDGDSQYTGHLDSEDIANEKSWDINGLRNSYQTFQFVR